MSHVTGEEGRGHKELLITLQIGAGGQGKQACDYHLLPLRVYWGASQHAICGELTENPQTYAS